MSYVLAIDHKDTEAYWTGESYEYGAKYPKRTLSLARAKRFKTAREGYESAGRHPKLAEWKVVRA